jgi:hypothetical protein
MENLTSIEVLAKTTEENLRQKNADFLAKYPTDDAQIDYYTKLAMNVFDEFQIDGTFTEHGVRKNVKVWFNNKRSQMELFRKHPYWNEEAKAIVFAHTEARGVQYHKARSALADILTYAKDKLEDYRYDKFLMGIYAALRDSSDNTGIISDGFIQLVNREIGDLEVHKDLKRMLKSGTKITKIVRKAFTMYHKNNGDVVDATTLEDEHEDGDRSFQSFEKLYAKFADTLSELTIKKVTLVSLHFCDFMLMSNGNSWSSCHYINSNNIFHESSTSSYSGCYKQGCLSYALDEPSFLFYTLPDTYDGEEYYREQKINRMCCQYNDGILVTGKCYPNNEDSYITRYRQTLQFIISSIENIPNSWTFSRNVNRITSLVTTEYNSAHYRDYEKSDQKPTISICKGHGIDLDNLMTIGHEAYCVHCGEELDSDDEKWLQCDDHRIKPVCARCGRYIEDEDDRHVIYGELFCDDCCFYCDYHGQYELISDGVNRLDMEDGRTLTICDDAMDNYVRCESCHHWTLRDETYQLRGETYCKECFAEKIKTLHPSGKFEVVPQSHYDVGDYVLMADDVRVCIYSTNDDMETRYPGRIVKIKGKGMAYRVKVCHDDPESWSWSPDCFVGKLYGDNLGDHLLGKFIEEV